MKRGIKYTIGFGIVSLFTFICYAANGMAKDPEYPVKPIEFIITYGAGGETDISNRALCDAASKLLQQPIIPINKPGASGVIGTVAIKESKPDGYKLGSLTRSPAFVSPFTIENISYDILRDFTPIINYGKNLDLLLVRGDKPWKTWNELVEWARKHPGEIKVGMTGPQYGQVHGISLSRIELKENLKFTYIPFKSAMEVLTALMGGNIDLYASSMDASTWDYISTEKVRIIAFLSKSKLPGYEKIPSLEEIYGISTPGLMAVMGPKGLPSYVTKKLEAVFAQAVKDPVFVSVMKRMYTPIIYMNGEEVREYIEKTYRENEIIIKQLKKEEAKK